MFSPIDIVFTFSVFYLSECKDVFLLAVCLLGVFELKQLEQVALLSQALANKLTPVPVA